MEQPDHDRQRHFRIAIIGAGIGGLALAVALNHQNVPFVLYESAAEHTTVGAGVGIGPNAMRAMDMIDKRFREKYDQVCTGNLTPGKEHVMMTALRLEEGFGVKNGWVPRSWGSETYTRTAAHRKTLLDIMTSLIPAASVKFNKRVLTIQQCYDRVSIRFEDGEVAHASAVIGCDGLKGFTRCHVLAEHPDEVRPQYSGQYAYRAVIAMNDAREAVGDLADDAQMYFGVGVNLSTYVISRGAEINLVGFVQDSKAWADKSKVIREVGREQMIEDFAKHNVDQRLLKLLRWAKPVQWGMFHHPKTSTYWNGLVCLLGDSAHASLPHQAAGAGQCLEDAIVLSRLLALVVSSESEDQSSHETAMRLKAAFEAYDSVRRPRAQRQIETSVECGRLYNLTHPSFGDNMDRVLDTLDHRFDWLWDHDLAADVEEAKDRYHQLLDGQAETVQ